MGDHPAPIVSNRGPMQQARNTPPIPSPGGAVLRTLIPVFAALAVFSAVINVLMLTGSLFMLEVYDRVLPGRSLPTLVGLCILAAGLFTFQAVLEVVRSRLFARIGSHYDRTIGPKLFGATMRGQLDNRAGDGLQPIRDLDTVRGFLSGPGPAALFDLPWVPLYVTICFAFHPLIGWTVTLGAAVLVVLTVANEWLAATPVRQTAAHAATRTRLAETARINAEPIAAMGMGRALARKWQEVSAALLERQTRSADVANGIGAVGRSLRMMLQSGVLAVGAYLVLRQEASAGIIIASSILAGRALAPIDQTIAQWRGFVAARQAWFRQDTLLRAKPDDPDRVALPAPRRNLSVEGVAIAAPGTAQPIVRDIRFTLPAGSAVGVIGPSGSGKSTLARALVGAWRPLAGAVRLDGAALDQWPAEDRGRHIGYLPQNVDLLEGSVSENIARFDPDATDEEVVAAAREAGVHEMIVALPEGYNTRIGEQGRALSAGQRQRVALARALFRDPFLIVLDEPNSNLDAEGDEALGAAIAGVRARGGVVVVVAHRPGTLASVDYVLAMRNGQMQGFGPRDEILAKVLRPPAAGPLKAVATGARP